MRQEFPLKKVQAPSESYPPFPLWSSPFRGLIRLVLTTNQVVLNLLLTAHFLSTTFWSVRTWSSICMSGNSRFMDSHTIQQKQSSSSNDGVCGKHIDITTAGVSARSDEDDQTDIVHKGALFLASAMMKLKKNSPTTELMKVPRFGGKLISTPDDAGALQRRLDKIYRSKTKAFEWPRYREKTLRSGANELETATSTSSVGRLSVPDMSVKVIGLRGSWNHFFGSHGRDETGQHFTLLSPFEGFFLVDAGLLEVVSPENHPLSVEDLRAHMEASVTHFSSRYGIFSEIHRSSQLFLKNYGDKVRTQERDSLKREKRKTSSVQEPQPKYHKSHEAAHGSTNLNAFGHESQAPSQLQRDIVGDPVRSDPSVARGLLLLPLSPNVTTENLATKLGPCGFLPAALDEIPSLFSDPRELHDRYERRRDPGTREFPVTFDLAFSGYRKSISGPSRKVFDVALTDFQSKDVPIADLFNALRQRKDATLPLYVVRESTGQQSGFSAFLADIPVVEYAGLASDISIPQRSQIDVMP